jgi:hypothetical protein
MIKRKWISYHSYVYTVFLFVCLPAPLWRLERRGRKVGEEEVESIVSFQPLFVPQATLVGTHTHTQQKRWYDKDQGG